MRTTIEITDQQRARLLEIAARRGEKGFSGVVREAIDHYLEGARERADKRRAALDLMGSLNGDDTLRKRCQNARGPWR